MLFRGVECMRCIAYCSAKNKAPTEFLVLTISKLAGNGSDEQGGQEDGTPDGGILCARALTAASISSVI